MAFPRASGWNNLDQGNAFPEIFSQKVLMFFRKASVAEDITNTDYEGEISDKGDTVRIIKEPTIVTQSYTRGKKLDVQDLVDEEETLVVDQANAFAFHVDDIEKKQSHINWESLAVGSAAYSLRDAYDTNIMSFISDSATTANTYGTNAAPRDVGFDVGEEDPANVIARLARLLDDANVPEEGRWFVAKPAFWEQLAQTDSKLMDASFTGESGTDIRNKLNNGRVSSRKVHGFTLYKSNNVPTPTGSNATYMALAGHMSAVSTANQIAKTEMIRSPDSFLWIVRGLHVFGRADLRPTAIAKAFMTID